MGTPGSGKSLLLELFMHSLLPDETKGPFGSFGLNYRAAIYDPKRSLYRFFLRCGVSPDLILVTHPFDARCSAWDLAADFRDRGDAQALATALVPTRRHTGDTRSSDFWTNAANQTVACVIEALIRRAPGGWDLRDVTEACSHPSVIEQLLKATRDGRDIHRDYFQGAKDANKANTLARDIQATIRSYLYPYGPLAALWHRAKTTFSLTGWCDGTGILLLGSDPRRQDVLQTLNQLLIRRMTQLVLARPDMPPGQPTDLTWCLFDEIREAGHVPQFRQLLTLGRSKGARVAIGFQDLSGLHAAFGEKEARELIANCGNKALLHAGSPETTQWASTVFSEDYQRVYAHSYSQEGKQQQTVHDERRPQYLPVDFSDLELAEITEGAIDAFFQIPAPVKRTPTGERIPLGAYADRLTAAEVRAALPAPEAEAAALLGLDKLPGDFVERQDEQERVAWNDERFAQLGLKRPNDWDDAPCGDQSEIKELGD